MSRSNKVKFGIVTDAPTTYEQKHSKSFRKLAESIRLDDNVDIIFESHPIVSHSDILGAAYAGGDAKTVPMTIDGVYFEQTNIGAKTILNPVLRAGGLGVEMDEADNEGIELNNGVTTRNPSAYTVGTDTFDFVCEATVTIADVSGTDDCAFGIRKVEAHQAGLDDYDEMAVLNVISGAVKAETILNGGTTSTSASLATVADGGSVTLKLIVRQNGSTEFYVDGTQQSVNFTFDSGEVIIPFFQFVHATTSPGDITLSAWKAGKH